MNPIRFKNKENIQKHMGKPLKKITIQMLSFDFSIPFVDPITLKSLKRKIEIEVYNKGYDITEFSIAVEPAGIFLFKDKYTIVVYCHPRTEKAKKEFSEMKAKEHAISNEQIDNEYKKQSPTLP